MRYLKGIDATYFVICKSEHEQGMDVVVDDDDDDDDDEYGIFGINPIEGQGHLLNKYSALTASCDFQGSNLSDFEYAGTDRNCS
ncbi:hypothetical protein GX48_02388 [Paracoccidioides brasiliensis]|nr:hypothetical protein GX48_02388 [Paracoccidioides brasiliensis]